MAVRFRNPHSLRAAFTLIELLVSLTVIAILVAILLPAVQSARESARQMRCKSNLRQLSLACSNYESQHGMYPPGATRGFGWFVCLLPYLDQDQQAVFDRIDFSKKASDQGPLNQSAFPVALCPSDGRAGLTTPTGTASISYAANSGTGVQAAGYNGMFRHMVNDPYPSGPIRARDVVDGATETALLAELLPGDGSGHWLRVNWQLVSARAAPDELDEFAQACVAETPRQFANGVWYGDTWSRGRIWLQGDNSLTWYNHVLTPQQPSCQNGSAVQPGAYTAASLHAGGVNVTFVDGHVEFVSASIDRDVWRSYGSRVDRELPQ